MGFNQKINDSMNNMSRSVTTQMMKEAPPDLTYVYIGAIDEKTRPFCLDAASQGALTEAQILELGGEYAESLVSGGGINCRHNWELASDDIQSQFHRGGEAQKIIDAKSPIDILSSKMAGKHKNVQDAEKFLAKTLSTRGNVDLSAFNNDINRVNKFTKTLSSLNVKYGMKIDEILPNTAKNLTKYDNIMEIKSLSKKFEKGVDFGQWNTMRINGKFFEHLDTDVKLESFLKKQHNANWSYSKNLSDLVTHEYGHLLTNKINNPQELLLKGIGSTSIYGQTNISESIAETFLKYSKKIPLNQEETDLLQKWLLVKI
tara:strand:+ start:407 stop:1354 length:948 start_codon:yes stop_codon:yes gene_type:complete